MTLYEILQAITDRILVAHPFFKTGYPFARQNSELGIVLTLGSEKKQVGITDTEGDYFYIRIADKITGTYSKGYSDCESAITERLTCSLVAVVKDADEFALKDSVQNQVMKINGAMVKAIYIDPITIMNEELKGLDEKVINRAKGHLKNMTLVRIDFDIERVFQTNNCIYNICPTC